MAILIPIAFFFAVAIIVKFISDNKIRRQLIDKGIVDENIKYLYTYEVQPLSSIKWGVVLIGIGLALLIGQIFHYEISEEVTIGLMFLFAGIGFVIYYFMAKKKLSDDNSKE